MLTALLPPYFLTPNKRTGISAVEMRAKEDTDIAMNEMPISAATTLGAPQQLHSTSAPTHLTGTMAQGREGQGSEEYRSSLKQRRKSSSGMYVCVCVCIGLFVLSFLEKTQRRDVAKR
jgi:hypothetical protein